MDFSNLAGHKALYKLPLTTDPRALIKRIRASLHYYGFNRNLLQHSWIRTETELVLGVASLNRGVLLVVSNSINTRPSAKTSQFNAAIENLTPQVNTPGLHRHGRSR